MTDLNEADEKIGKMRSDEQISKGGVDAAEMPKAMEERVKTTKLTVLGLGARFQRGLGENGEDRKMNVDVFALYGIAGLLIYIKHCERTPEEG